MALSATCWEGTNERFKPGAGEGSQQPTANSQQPPMSAEQRLSDLGIDLPQPPAPAGLYAPARQTGPLLYISGQLPTVDGRLQSQGKLGETVSIDEGANLARICTINALAIVRQHLGTLDRVVQVVRIAGYVASGPGFIEHPRVINGASQLLIDVFGEAGRHARIAVGMAELPGGAPVEVEYLFEVRR
jgi:enamine deaminase RidA (YjgF/YER057c/UK114 family)